jgi:hypothetical protein
VDVGVDARADRRVDVEIACPVDPQGMGIIYDEVRGLEMNANSLP